MKKLIETNNVSYSDIFGNSKSYKVPFFQRDYSWSEENWDDFWMDIEQVVLEKNETHYMGAVVLKTEEGKTFSIIDGQQRFTTVSVFILAAIKFLNELAENGIDTESNSENADLLYDKYIGSKVIGSLQRKSKLELNKNNYDFYQFRVAQLKEPINEYGLSDSNRQIWKCYKFFKAKLDKFGAGKPGKEVAEFIEKVADALMFIQIVVENEFNAFTLFETLNARGVELSVSDLLKNYLLSLLSESALDVEQAIKQWNTIAEITGLGNLSDFIRYYWNSRYHFTRKSNLFRTIQQSIKTKQQVLTLLDDLEKNATVFVALQNPGSDYWHQFQERKTIVKHLKELRLFKVKQPLPLLMVANIFLDEQVFVKILRICSIISFRYYVIGKYNPNELEQTYSTTAREIFNKNLTSPKQVFKALKNVYKTDEVFESDFVTAEISTKQTRQKSLVRYILTEIENFLSQNLYDFEDQPVSIEHVLPEQQDGSWYNIFKEPEKYTYRLGNYILLEETLNQDCGAKPFNEKLEIYKKSKYQVANTIRFDEWDSNAIVSHQEQFAKYAKSIWRLDY